MVRLAQAGLTKRAVAGQLERLVRPHRGDACLKGLTQLRPKRYGVALAECSRRARAATGAGVTEGKSGLAGAR